MIDLFKMGSWIEKRINEGMDVKKKKGKKGGKMSMRKEDSIERRDVDEDF